MYKLLPQSNIQIPDSLISEAAASASTVPLEFLCEAVFAGDSFLTLEAAFGRLDGVVKTAAGYCGGNLRKPTHREVCEGRTGHTEAVKVTYDSRMISFASLCDVFWNSHDPTKRDFLGFGISTHLRSAIFYCGEVQRKGAQESKIRRQMKLNRRIVTKITPLDSEFFLAQNQYQKYYLQKHHRVCESLSLRSTEQFVESTTACRLNGILAMDRELIVHNLTTFLEMQEVSKQAKLACQEIIADLRRDHQIL